MASQNPPADTDDDSQMSQAVWQATSQQPSAEALASLGIKVRDFAYENTLPAINPVPRVPRQVQPTPPSRKRPQSDDCDDIDTPIASATSQPGGKRPRVLERKSTEPLQEPPVQHTRTLGRITLTRVCSIIISPPRRALPPAPHTRFSASPPTSPLTPPLHLASQDSQLVQTPPAFPFVVHVDDTSMIPTSQLDSESQPASFRPTLYSMLSRPSLCCSPAPSPQNASPAPLSTPFLELSSPNKELKAKRVRKRRNHGIPSTMPYQLRLRPIPSPRTSTLSQRSHQATNTSSKSRP